jgi:hypothetical protein
MKQLFALAVLILLSSVPSFAQRPAGGGVGGAGGSIGGGTSRLPVYPSHDFQATYVTGSDDFTPSTFVPYDQALTDGRNALAARARSLADAAKESRNSERPRAKFTIMQDGNGRLVVESQ